MSASPAASLYRVPTQPRPAVARPRVVLVDDEVGILEVWRTILSFSGYDVQCFSDPACAVKAILQGCDLVITDYHMPKMTGIDLIRRVKPWSKAKFIVITANTADTVANEALSAGASCVVHKPTSAPLVLQKLASLCG